MSPADRVIDQLRAELASLNGSARMAPLARLGQALLQRCTQNSLGSPTALSDLDAAISAFREAISHMRPDDPLCANLKFYLGYSISARTNHTATEADRNESINLLREVLDCGRLPAPVVVGAQTTLGAQYLGRAMMGMSAVQSVPALMAVQTSQSHVPDIDRASECFHAVLAGEAVSTDVTDLARMSLELCAAIKVLLGGVGGLDFQKLTEAMVTLQKLQERAEAQSKPGYGPFQPSNIVSFPHLSQLVNLDPLDRPVMVVEGTAEEDEPAAPELVEPPVELVPVEPVDLRADLYRTLAINDVGVPVWESAVALLSPEAKLPAVVDVDEAVAMASTVVDQDGETAAPEVASLDLLLLAVCLHLRDRVDTSTDGADRIAGAEVLLTAARRAPADHPIAVVILRAVGAFLDPARPLGGLPARSAAGFAGRFDAVLAEDKVTDVQARTGLHALRCFCRAIWAFVELDRATAELPLQDPLRDRLHAAVRSIS